MLCYSALEWTIDPCLVRGDKSWGHMGRSWSVWLFWEAPSYGKSKDNVWQVHVTQFKVRGLHCVERKVKVYLLHSLQAFWWSDISESLSPCPLCSWQCVRGKHMLALCAVQSQWSSSQAESLETPDASGPKTRSGASTQKQLEDKVLMHCVPLGITSFFCGGMLGQKSNNWKPRSKIFF